MSGHISLEILSGLGFASVHWGEVVVLEDVVILEGLWHSMSLLHNEEIWLEFLHDLAFLHD